ncbi:hypothetical protein HG535_0A06110 [Zygotorulaspora mrakii]|uniref:Serine/threonine-protein phosphatase 2A activator n=1 Tax=Zygotorulaspora mrakii TaxID=42260 RepID=A0A7H9AY18_ZYGMR|nr:uncharacterized protein HG535_0A06110 [Zygotorulaspora mrakii]QLG70669.1 hypothetical protein HG535_0A06110 [Zygotorulaspora mrakii]
MIPEKRLLTKDDILLWENSETRHKLVDFLTSLAEAVKGHENTDYKEPISESIKSVVKILNRIRELVKKNPVTQDANSSRFGKVEFRDFYHDVSESSTSTISDTFPSLSQDQVTELSAYLTESWGNERRIDYGSGHELNFLCFLYGLLKCNIFQLERDARNMVLKVFITYLDIMRLIETTYWLEPAGSHGVWGLDDYHFLPFLFGAFQLSTHPHLKPTSIHNGEVVEMFQDKYLYFGCIAFINSVKTVASLRWHSPMLDDISGVRRWAKVAGGMVKMYEAEVLGKLPIMQHFLFGEFLPCPEGVSPLRDHSHDDDEGVDCCHVHDHSRINTWGDCCGIKVPSAIAATQMNKKNHKPIPFD